MATIHTKLGREKNMKRNIGNTDRIVRVILAVLLAVGAWMAGFGSVGAPFEPPHEHEADSEDQPRLPVGERADAELDRDGGNQADEAIGPFVSDDIVAVHWRAILPESPLNTPRYRRLADAPDVAAGAEPAAR